MEAHNISLEKTLADAGSKDFVVESINNVLGDYNYLNSTERAIKAVVPFYGYPSGDMEPDWSGLTATVRGHMAENDDFFGPEGAHALEEKLSGLGKDVSFTVHAGTGHAFMGPHNALGTLDEAKQAEIWPGVLAFLHEQLG